MPANCIWSVTLGSAHIRACSADLQARVPGERFVFAGMGDRLSCGPPGPDANPTQSRIMAGMNLDAIQSALREAGFDGWLFYDHHHRDPIGGRILGLDEKAHITRRWYYYVPAEGDPRKLVHRIEQGRLDSLPGAKGLYSSWQELAAGLDAMLFDAQRIAMQYSPNNAIMYVSMVDAGTVEFLRGLGKQIVSSADLVSQFEAVLNEEQIASHAIAQQAIDKIVAEGWQEIARRLRPSGAGSGWLTEFDLVVWLSEAMRREGLVWANGPTSAPMPTPPTPTMSPRRRNPRPLAKVISC